MKNNVNMNKGIIFGVACASVGVLAGIAIKERENIKDAIEENKGKIIAGISIAAAGALGVALYHKNKVAAEENMKRVIKETEEMVRNTIKQEIISDTTNALKNEIVSEINQQIGVNDIIKQITEDVNNGVVNNVLKESREDILQYKNTLSNDFASHKNEVNNAINVFGNEVRDAFNGLKHTVNKKLTKVDSELTSVKADVTNFDARMSKVLLNVFDRNNDLEIKNVLNDNNNVKGNNDGVITINFGALFGQE